MHKFNSKALLLLLLVSSMFLGSYAEKTQNRDPSSSLHSNETHFSFFVDETQLKNPDIRDFSTAESLLRRITNLEGSLEGFSHKNDKTTKFVYTKLNGIVGTIHSAYMNHLPLQLSVSDFITLIGQGLAKHMQNHAEDVRPHFVDFEGKEKIQIVRGDIMPGQENDWSTVFGEFAEEIRKRVKLDFYDVMVDDTSVATKLSRIASEITIMDTFQKYFEYELFGCAMTKVTLVGTTEDWEMLRSKVHKLKALNEGDRLLLDWWLEHLVPTIDKIVDQAVSRQVDIKFWENIYAFQEDDDDCSPKDTMSGWIKYFKPYLGTVGGRVWRSDFTNIETSILSNDVSRVPFLWIPTPELKIPMLIFGGVLGTKIHEDGTLEPEYFYAVAEKAREVANPMFGYIQDDDAKGPSLRDSDVSDYSDKPDDSDEISNMERSEKSNVEMNEKSRSDLEEEEENNYFLRLIIYFAIKINNFIEFIKKEFS